MGASIRRVVARGAERDGAPAVLTRVAVRAVAQLKDGAVRVDRARAPWWRLWRPAAARTMALGHPSKDAEWRRLGAGSNRSLLW